ncbi:MAG: hypothetical protein ACR2PG_23385 [Hyphomicrobiaceae bacterium]
MKRYVLTGVMLAALSASSTLAEPVIHAPRNGAKDVNNPVFVLFESHCEGALHNGVWRFHKNRESGSFGPVTSHLEQGFYILTPGYNQLSIETDCGATMIEFWANEGPWRRTRAPGPQIN